MPESNLEITAHKILNADKPEEVFGLFASTDKSEQFKLLVHSYRVLFKVIAPDLNNKTTEDLDLATKSLARLNELKAKAEAYINSGKYGKEDPVVITSAGKTYTLKKKVAGGNLAKLYLAEQQILKVVNNPADNDLLEVERSVLTEIRAQLLPDNKCPKCLTYIPKVNSSFLMKVGTGQHRINVLSYFEETISLKDAVIKAGFIDGRTSGWMFKRIFTLLPWIHSTGYVHGAILPPHMLVRPDNYNSLDRDPFKHAVMLVDWCYAAKIGQKAKAWDAQYAQFYPPEVSKKEPLTSATDVYMAASTICWALGGNYDASTKHYVPPIDYPTEMGSILLKCMNPNPKLRPTCDVLFNEMVTALQTVYGPRKWHQFIVPK